MQQIRITILFLALLALAVGTAFTQNAKGVWTLGFHGGANVWISDYNQHKVGEGGEIMLRYGITDWFSAGVVGGYEELRAQQSPASPIPGMTNGYLKLHAIPLAMVGYIHLAPQSDVNPYLYAGLGAMLYKRVNGSNVYIPNSQFNTTVLVPVGLGLEIAVSKNISLVADAGYHVTDDYLDYVKSGNLGSYVTGKVGFNILLGTGDGGDADNDGLTNGEEKTFMTDPNNADTDGDGLNDGDEVHKYKTNPLKADTDGDGLKDGEEVTTYKTDPNKTDTDGDGLIDGEEVLTLKTDPLNTDTDHDGLSDGDEVQKYKSDPLKTDSDADGLSDSDEVLKYKTDPMKMDTDGDALNDADEVNKYKTDPLKIDTDNGGVNDGAEVTKGTNPLDPKDDVTKETVTKTNTVFIDKPIVLERGKTVVLKGVNFETGKATLTEDSKETLQKAYDALVASPDVQVEISGHTDSVGSKVYNRDLSTRRAKSVKAWLVKAGIRASRMTTVGKGMDFPMDVNSTAEGRANNRRIEFLVKK